MRRAVPEKFVGSEDWLHETAAAQVGASDFGGPEYLTGLRVLLEAYDADVKLDENGRERVFGLLLSVLIARLYAEQGWRRHPECLATEIHRPLIITGVPRTGTTTMQRLLSLDPRHQGVELWLSKAPMVRPPRDQWESHPVYQSTKAAMDALYQVHPEVRLIHEMLADEVDEDYNILVQNFCNNTFPAQVPIPTYDRWWRAQDETPSHLRFADNLKLIGFAEPDKRWVLRNPGHILSLDAVMAAFPDGLIIQTHRDPLKAIPSVCSLIMYGQRDTMGAQFDPVKIGRRENELWAFGVACAMKAQDQHPEKFYNVQFDDLLRDPIGVVRGVYRWAGMELVPAVEAKMNQWLKAHEAAKPGFHRYRAEDFGLTADQIRREYADYIERYYGG
jgi:Sulfotransferase family